MKASEEDEIGPAGLSRRQWVATSAALVAGSLAACNTSRAGGGDARSSERPALPGFDAARRTSQLSATVGPEEERFVAWNAALRASAAGRESAFVDLDAVDHNLKLVGGQLGSTMGLRLGAKSLPSVQLLEYMMVAAGTNRIMAFSEGTVRDLLIRFGSDVDILLGRPAAVDACARTFATLDELGAGPNPTGSVRWLVDTAERMREYAALAATRGEAISISIEIDVGLHRGGARDADQLRTMLRILDESGLLRFAGFMGYDGHVPFVPPDRGSSVEEFAAVQRRYAEFVQAGQDAYPALFEGPVVYNGGGSRTYHSYTDDLDTPINEVAMGSAFFYPSNFHNLPETGLRTATFFATPVLKRLDPAELYPDPDYLPSLAASRPDFEVWYVQVSGGFPGDRRFPRGLVPSPTTTGDPTRIVNMMPNQGRWLGARGLPLQVGDFIFYQPWEADAVRWLAYLDVFRGAQLVDQWSTLQPGVRLATDV